jgi:serine/threonine protein kinase
MKMAHLEIEKLVHRDLATRNILLTAKFEAVVSDFGFARTLNDNNTGNFLNSSIDLCRKYPESYRSNSLDGNRSFENIDL